MKSDFIKHFVFGMFTFLAPIGLWAGEGTDFPDQPPAAPPLKAAQLPKPFVTTLDNGMDVVVISNSEVPWVSISLMLPIGAQLDPEEKIGLASVTVSMLTQGTRNYTSDELAEKMDTNAISISGSAGIETTAVYASSLKDQINLSTELLAEVVRQPVFPEKDFLRTMKQTLQSKAVEEVEPTFQVMTTYRKWLYGDHPQGRESNGETATLQNIRRKDLEKFHQQYYMPNGSTLIFSGDIQPEQAVGLAKKYFADWPKGELPKFESHPLPPAEPTRIVLIDRSTSKQIKVVVGHLGYNRFDPDYTCGQLFNQVFGGGFVSRLNHRIRVVEGLTYGAGGSFSTSRETGALTAFTFTRPDMIGKTINILLEEIKKMQEVHPTAEELNDGKSYLVGSFALSMETPQEIASKVWDLKFYGLPYDYYDGYFKQIDSLTSEQVQAFARKHLHPDQIKIVVVGNAEEVKSQLEAIAPVTVIKPGEKVPPPNAPADSPQQ